MAVQAQFGGVVLPTPYAAAEEQQVRAFNDYGALLLSAAAAATPGAEDAYAWPQYDYCAAQSEVTSSRKRGREDDELLLHYHAPFQPLPGTAASTSGRPVETTAADALASELCRHDAEVDNLVRAECARLRAGLEVARTRQRQALVRAAVSSLARRARDAEAQLDAARRRAAELEERVRLATAEAQAWCGVARGNEAVAAGLQATLDAVLSRSVSAVADDAAEGAGESEPDDAQSSCCCEQAAVDGTGAAATATSSSSTWKGNWACRACGAGEASVLVLPCRHLCLCKACEPRADACPVCAGAKNAAIHIAPNC